MLVSLCARDLTFSYPGSEKLFEGFSLDVEPGERVAIVAPSGAGKTTLCRLLAGYLAPQAGEVLVDGAALAEYPKREPRPVQLIWQHPEQAFDPLVCMGRSLAEGGVATRRGAKGSLSAASRDTEGSLPASRDTSNLECEQLLERFGIRRPWLDRFPHELSGGELMRFCIVRALLTRPRYLVCDEMTAMLDAVTQAELWREVLGVASECDMGIIFVSHSPALVRRIATREVRI